MTFNNNDDAINFINQQEPTFLTKAKKRGYVCPICGNGNGSEGTGIEKIPNSEGHKKYKCFKCGESFDILDLIKENYSLMDFNDTLKKGAEIYGISLNNDISAYTTEPTATPSRIEAEKEAEPQTDFTEFYKSCQIQEEKGAGYEYLKSRGINLHTIKKYKLGFSEKWKNPKSDKAPLTPRVIIPTSKFSYLARDIRRDEDLSDTEKKFTKAKAGQIHIFNLRAVSKVENEPLFIVEGEIDALSIIEAGAEAVAIGGTSNTDLLIRALEKVDNAKNINFIIALDNDDPGRKAGEKLRKALLENGYKCEFVQNLYGSFNDANDYLTMDKDAFTGRIKEIKKAGSIKVYHAIKQIKAVNLIPGFLDEINTVKHDAIPTGFKNLDSILDGGLYEGLYVLGAISALGKTTFLQQIGDQIAESGKDVLYISLEMSKYELMAKSISRNTYKIFKNNSRDYMKSECKTTRGILTAGAKSALFTRNELELIAQAIEDYREKPAKHLYIFEGLADIGMDEIEKTATMLTQINEDPPVIIIDYLQILKPYDVKATDKQNADRNIVGLKRLSRDLNTPVLVISSFNRDNYNSDLTMRAFKESGSIEYSADVLAGLQLKLNGDKSPEAIQNAISEIPRKVEFKILKNRNGQYPKSGIDFLFNPMFNHFEES